MINGLNKHLLNVSRDTKAKHYSACKYFAAPAPALTRDSLLLPALFSFYEKRTSMPGVVEARTMEGKIRAFIILTSDREATRKTGKRGRTRERRNPFRSLTDGIGWKAPPLSLKEDRRRYAAPESRCSPFRPLLFPAISFSFLPQFLRSTSSSSSLSFLLPSLLLHSSGCSVLFPFIFPEG